MAKTCFVVMAIGEQSYGETKISSAELKSKYSDLIKEAILKSYPDMDVTRADEVAVPGSITSDIVARIIHADIVVADVTYPNPNVFYELGLRHASRSGTIIIKDRSGPRVPFDIAHLRYIEYDNTIPGLRELAAKLKEYIDFSLENPDKPDNTYLEFAKYTKLKGYDFSDPIDSDTEMVMALFRSPDLLELLTRASSGQEIPQAELFKALTQNPEASAPIMRAITQSYKTQTESSLNRATRRKTSKK